METTPSNPTPAAAPAPAAPPTPPAPTVTPMETVMPKTPPASAMTGGSEDNHSHIGLIALAIGLLLVGLAAGSFGGYYYADMMKGAAEPATEDMQQTVPTGSDSTVNAADVSTDTTVDNPLDGVKTNPFE